MYGRRRCKPVPCGKTPYLLTNLANDLKDKSKPIEYGQKYVFEKPQLTTQRLANIVSHKRQLVAGPEEQHIGSIS